MNYLEINGTQFYNMILNGANELEKEKEEVNALNVFPVPDGDTGTNMSMTFRAAATSIIEKQNLGVNEIAKVLSKGALMGARGNSGVILSQIFRGIAKGLENSEKASTKDFAKAIKEGANSAYKAVMRPTEGTILTIIRAAGEAALKSEAKDMESLLREVCTASEVMLKKTQDMLPALKEAGVVDAGGMGLLIIFKGMLKVLEDGLEVELHEEKAVGAESKATKGNLKTEDITFGYCTEFFIVDASIEPEDFREEIDKMGDSIIVVGDEGLIKTHIHTNNPGKVLSIALSYGEIAKIKIDNMREQHREILEKEYSHELLASSNTKKESKKIKEYAFISVAMGEGIEELFKENLGVDCVITGGQTMNPSTQDFVNSIENLNAKDIYVFPNNKNIIMAANQARDISDKNVHVIETTTLPQGITAITMFNPESSTSENLENMKAAIKEVKSASVTYAVRDTEMDGIQIKENDILGLIEGKIAKVGNDQYEVVKELIDSMVDSNSELINIYYGEGTEKEKVNELIANLEEKYEDFDIIYYEGKQPVYSFVLSVE